MKEEARVVLETGLWYDPLLVLVFTWTQAAQVLAWTWVSNKPVSTTMLEEANDHFNDILHHN